MKNLFAQWLLPPAVVDSMTGTDKNNQRLVKLFTNTPSIPSQRDSQSYRAPLSLYSLYRILINIPL